MINHDRDHEFKEHKLPDASVLQSVPENQRERQERAEITKEFMAVFQDLLIQRGVAGLLNWMVFEKKFRRSMTLWPARNAWVVRPSDFEYILRCSLQKPSDSKNKELVRELYLIASRTLSDLKFRGQKIILSD